MIQVTAAEAAFRLPMARDSMSHPRPWPVFIMKTIVLNKLEGTEVPFIRGILTRSLLDAGMPFDEAFDFATRVRKQISKRANITHEELRELVAERLEGYGDTAVRRAYSDTTVAPGKILVISRSGGSSAFSRGRLENYLEATGLEARNAEKVTARVYDQLLVHGAESITTDELGLLTYLCVREEIGKKAARRFLIWTEFQRSGRPLLLLVGGAVGTGKSTLATELAHRLGIVRTQSTDMLREVMRTMIPAHLMPVLHASSFDAWKALPAHGRAESRQEDRVVEGFYGQVQLLEVSCQATLHRAENESVSMILEGVHVLPSLRNRWTGDDGPICVHVTMAILRKSMLKDRLLGRRTEAPKRHADLYLANLDSIWALQSHLLSEADENETAIVENDNFEKSSQRIIVSIIRELARHFDGTPAGAFGDEIGALLEEGDEDNWQQWAVGLINR